ncbi:MAG TPA: DUF4398 domain-containing protein [Rudaea sp.]|uniref:DUF4398 domain-containing protein n=1 Tax=Rudaea sp. TaxID=2136325 RepID=UPI002F91D258
MSSRKTLIALAFCVSQLTGCAQTKPPLAQLDDAGRRVEAARGDGAATYAPMELRTAAERLSLARAAMKDEDYDQAAQLADEAQIAGELAQAKTRLGKARERVDTRTQENAQLRSDLSIGSDADQGGQ